MRIGQKEKAISLLHKVLKKVPDFEEARFFLEKLEKEIPKEK